MRMDPALFDSLANGQGGLSHRQGTGLQVHARGGRDIALFRPASRVRTAELHIAAGP